jgi:hypothetical protein
MTNIAYDPISSESISGGADIELFFINRLPRTVIPYSGYGGQGFQVFTAARIVSASAGQQITTRQTSDTAELIAIRV